VRRSDGSISIENQELRENQEKTVQGIVNFFSKDFFNREPRLLIGYNYFPDFPMSIEVGYLKNGLGLYGGIGLEPENVDNNYEFNYIGESIGIFNFCFGITYPLYFNWLWIAGGSEVSVVGIADKYVDYTWTNYLSKQDIGVNFSAGIYLTFKRFYITAKYRNLFYRNNKNSFMLGLGVGI
jgi:hypothetical protein